MTFKIFAQLVLASFVFVGSFGVPIYSEYSLGWKVAEWLIFPTSGLYAACLILKQTLQD